MSPIDPLGLVTNLATLGQMLQARLAEEAARRDVLLKVAENAVEHFSEDASFVITRVLNRDSVAQLLLEPPSPDRLDDLRGWFRDIFGEQPDRVTDKTRLDTRVTAFVRGVDDLLLRHGLHEAQALGQKIENARADILQGTADGETRLLQGQNQLQGRFDRQDQKLDELLRKVDASNDPYSDVKAHLEALQSIVRRGRVEVATDQALELRRVLLDAPAELKARFGRFIGVNLLSLNQKGQAVEELERALAAKPEDPELKLFAAGANLLAGDFPRAHNLAQQAFEVNESDEALGLLLQSTYWLEGIEAAEALAAEHGNVKGAAVSLGLAFILRREGRHKEAEALLRPYVPSIPTTINDVQLCSELAGVLVSSALQTLKAERPLPWQQPTTVTKKLEEAEVLLTANIAFLEKTDYRHQLAQDVGNRGVVRNLRWHDTRALKDHRRALELDPDAQLGRVNLARYHLTQDEFATAVDILLTIPENERTYEVYRLIGEARHLSDRSREALPFFEAAAERAETPSERAPVLAFLLDAHLTLGNENDAAALEARLEEESPHDLVALAIRAHTAFRQHDYEKMVGLYERALAQPDGQSFVGIDYANHLYSLERWSEAADQYAHIVSPDAFEEVTRHYAVALLNAGRQAEALSFSQAVRERHGVRLGVTEVEAHVLRWLGDMKADLSLWQALHDLDPHNHLLKLRVAESLMLTRDFGGARDVAEAVDWRKLKKHPGDVMRLAQLRGMLGLPGALGLAWEALRLAPNDPDVHLQFFSVAVQMNHNGPPADLKEVTPGSVVTLERGDGTTFSLTILEAREDLREGEVTTSSVEARRLLGRHVNEEIEWDSHLTGKRSVRIRAVIPILVHAVRNSLARFGDRFPDHPGVIMFRGENVQDTADKMAQVLLQKEEIRRPLFELYLQDHRLPLHALADGMFGGSVHQLRLWARGNQEHHLHAFDGRSGWTYRQRLRVHNAKRIVMDDSALLTLAELDLLGTLNERFDEVFVAASLLLELDTLVVQRTGRLEPDDLPGDLQLVQQVRGWVSQQAIQVPAYARLDLTPEVLTDTNEALGDAAADALYLAQSLNAPLFSDDLGLSLMAEGVWRVRPTNTLQHLQELRARKHLSFTAYTKLLAVLSRWHYSFISINAETLVEAFRAAPQGEEFPQLAGELGSRYTSEGSALQVGSNTIWLLLNIKSVDYRLCLDAMTIILNALSKRIDEKLIVEHMIRNILRRYLVRPSSQAIYIEFFRSVLRDFADQRDLL